MPTQDRCNNCSCPPPCNWSLCVQALPRICPCVAAVGGSTIRYQGPGDIDVTRTLACDRTSDCYADPPEGEWTITVSHPCFGTVVRTVAVVQCVSHTEIVEPPFNFTTLHYSDDEVSYDFNIASMYCLNSGLYRGVGCVSGVPLDYPITGWGSSDAYGNCDCNQTGLARTDLSVWLWPNCDGTFALYVSRVVWITISQPGCEAIYDDPCRTAPGLAKFCSMIAGPVTISCDSPAVNLILSACGPKPAIEATVSLS